MKYVWNIVFCTNGTDRDMFHPVYPVYHKTKKKNGLGYQIRRLGGPHGVFIFEIHLC